MSLIKQVFYVLKNKYSFKNKIKIIFTLFEMKLNKKILGHKISSFRYSTIEYLFNEIFISANYLFSTNEKSPLIIDCGSNIGMSIIFFKFIYPKSKIYAFEPDPQTFELLKKNIIGNKIKGVRLFNCALGIKKAKIPFFIDTERAGSLMMSTKQDRFPTGRKIKKIFVPSEKLTSFMKDKKVDILKIDVEGGEQDILTDLINKNKFKNIKNMVLEYHKKGKDNFFKNFLNYLNKNNINYKQIEIKKSPVKTPYEDVLIKIIN